MAETNVLVSVEHAAKRFHRGRAAYGTLRDSVRRLLLRRTPATVAVTALDDVSFDVQAGETLGIVGDNGAGKSTLLKVIARITPPDTGRVTVRGRVSALIEVGAGFHPELTAAENVILHGSILGLSRREMRRALGPIAAFAELEDGMDTPVKYFSTGMYARLGFAVAVHAAPRVLLVDEVLSVGDPSFRRKCYRRIAELRAGGTAILFVSHDLPAVAAVCDRALRLEHGRIVCAGAPDAVTADYEDARAGPGPQRRGTV